MFYAKCIVRVSVLFSMLSGKFGLCIVRYASVNKSQNNFQSHNAKFQSILLIQQHRWIPLSLGCAGFVGSTCTLHLRIKKNHQSGSIRNTFEFFF